MAARVTLDRRQAFEWSKADYRLIDLVCDALRIWPAAEMVVTCIARTEDEERAAGGKSGIHVSGPPWRACDVRITNLGDAYQERANLVAATLNAMWEYDESRPGMAVAVSKPHGTGPHIHFQVHPATKKVV